MGSHRDRRAAALWLAALLASGCRPVVTPTAEIAVRMVVTERWTGGGRLVVVDESGDRQAVLVEDDAAGGVVRDEQAAFSPDGRWIAFVSTRGRDLEGTSLWLVAARPGAAPVALTDGAGTDLSPTWTPDGAVVFASDRLGTYDLFRREVGVDGRPVGALVRLTDADSQELAPTVAPDGRIAAQVIELGRAARSYLAVVEAGRLVALTAGPLDGTPAWAPDGRRLAFATLSPGDDTELVVLDTGRDRPPVTVAELPTTDESAPVWSRDGRWLFATSTIRDAARAPIWSSVIAIDLRARPARPRMLRDRVGAIIRAGLALGPEPLDELALARGPDYLTALAAALQELDEVRAARELDTLGRSAPRIVPDAADPQP